MTIINSIDGASESQVNELQDNISPSSFQLVPAKVAFWTFGSINRSNGTVNDNSGQGNDLTNIGTVTFDKDGLAPYAKFDGGVNSWLRITDNAKFDITGNESYIEDNGMSIAGWWWFDAGGSLESMVVKWIGAPGQRSYFLRKTTGDKIQIILSSDGSSSYSFTTSASVDIAKWNYIAMILNPGATADIVINGTKEVGGAGAPASIFSGPADFAVGAGSTGGSPMTGRASHIIITSSRIANQPTFGDQISENLFNSTMVLFGR
jgi:hypothetical protein